MATVAGGSQAGPVAGDLVQGRAQLACGQKQLRVSLPVSAQELAQVPTQSPPPLLGLARGRHHPLIARHYVRPACRYGGVEDDGDGDRKLDLDLHDGLDVGGGRC
ncbi:hypothetical protein, partial [Phycicoccus flavus]|uniref:hypothetical protein n=1 Tax=Phycicoccus flavus TaxID=2502783 RepID=UPI00197B0DF2